MVEIIGLAAFGGLLWLLSWAMGAEADSERRSRPSAQRANSAEQGGVRQAA
jgi:hypothetical protein